jgi:hypothetical protein
LNPCLSPILQNAAKYLVAESIRADEVARIRRGVHKKLPIGRCVNKVSLHIPENVADIALEKGDS